ncbi:HAD family hydrolase [Streptomyces marincola]|uniref:Phosphoglycolate phosphatase n=1 Tax=Streptomyces marincola TaxID=2878388 RepID=A0A1W7D475_9ACTN|nr:HAD family hydrolase [Streptomyces marincola]ARQ71881.1 hypothetical protein CAG99_26350 [Streptomyces marincola]
MTDVAVFDLDGTLIDTPRGIVDTFTAAFATMAWDRPDPREVRATVGLPPARAFGRLMGAGPEDERVAEGMRQYRRHFRIIVLPRAPDLLFPGVAAGLADLRAQGLALALATGTLREDADALLTAAGLRDLFDVVVGADQVTHPTPHPQTGLTILRSLGAVPERAVLVGDTAGDLVMARACGMRSIAVTYGLHGAPQLRAARPTWLADSFEEVVARLTACRARSAAPAR